MSLASNLSFAASDRLQASEKHDQTHLLEVDIVAQFHVLQPRSKTLELEKLKAHLGVDAQDFETSSSIRNTNVDFSVETTETSESRVDRIGSVGSGHDDNV